MIRLGIIDFDTSHVAAFVSRVNHVGIEEDQWVDGAQFVVGCPGDSEIFPERIAEETAKVEKLGLPLVARPEEMLDYKLDGVFIESNSGMRHRQRAEFFLEHKLPLFVDKPFACSSADARAMVERAAQVGVPICSASSLRYAPQVIDFRATPDAKSPNLGCLSFGPAPTHEKNPGLFHYGIHAVEILYAILGPGCERLSNVADDKQELVSGMWRGGRLGAVRGQRPSGPYGFIPFVDGKPQLHACDTKFAYRDLLREMLPMFETGKAPIAGEELIEIARFIELATDSANNHGMPRNL